MGLRFHISQWEDLAYLSVKTQGLRSPWMQFGLCTRNNPIAHLYTSYSIFDLYNCDHIHKKNSNVHSKFIRAI